jgi:hypothetical protein
VNGGGWDLVILEEDYWTFIDASEYAAVADHIAAGGMAIVDSWGIGYDSTHQTHALWGLMGAQYAAWVQSDPLYWWDDSHPLFNNQKGTRVHSVHWIYALVVA